MRIDVHNHALPEPALDLLRREPVYRVEIRDGVITGGNHPPFPLTPDFHDPAAKLAGLEADGLEGAVVSVSPTLFYYELDAGPGEEMCRAVNAGLAELCAHDAERLHWMAHVPMQSPERAAGLLALAGEAGCVGVEVGTSIAGARLDDPRFEPFWAAAEELRLPVMLHPAYNEAHAGLDAYYLQNVIGNLLETTIAVERLICAQVLDRHPGVRLLLVHAGGFFPYQAGRLRHASGVRPELEDVRNPWSYLDQLWFDTITHDPDALRYLVARAGVEHVALGTDLPFDMAPPAPLDELREALDEASVRHVAEGTPARLFDLARQPSQR